MAFDLLAALALFAFVTSITPGPNNLMLMASGANFGMRRTLPHMLGVSLGHAFMVLCVGLGLASLFTAWPVAHRVLAAVSVVYLGWLAWRIATAAPPEPGAPAGRPFTFLQAAGFQWVNPKAWAMALTAVTVYAPGEGALAMAAVALVFCAVNLPSVGSWAWLGTRVARWLDTPARLRLFNRAMALLLVASLWPVLVPAGAG